MIPTNEAKDQRKSGVPANRDEPTAPRRENIEAQIADDQPEMPNQGLTIGEM